MEFAITMGALDKHHATAMSEKLKVGDQVRSWWNRGKISYHRVTDVRAKRHGGQQIKVHPDLPNRGEQAGHWIDADYFAKEDEDDLFY